MKIKVENLHMVNNKKSKVKMFCTVRLEGICVNDVKLIASDGKRWVAMPTRAYEKDGETNYSNVVFIDDEDLREEVSEKVLAAYEKEVSKNDN